MKCFLLFCLFTLGLVFNLSVFAMEKHMEKLQLDAFAESINYQLTEISDPEIEYDYDANQQIKARKRMALLLLMGCFIYKIKLHPNADFRVCMIMAVIFAGFYACIKQVLKCCDAQDCVSCNNMRKMHFDKFMLFCTLFMTGSAMNEYFKQEG